MIYRTLLKAIPLATVYCLSNVAFAEIKILKASTIITMDDKNPRAEALAYDTDTGKITAIGSLEGVRAKAPNAVVKDLGSTVLMPGFIDPHNHPILSGVSTQEPAIWIAPYVGYKTWADVKAKIKKYSITRTELATAFPVLRKTKDTPVELVLNADGTIRKKRGRKPKQQMQLDA